MPRLTAPDSAWLSAQVPKETARRFREAAQAADRSAAQQLRHLIRTHLGDGPDALAEIERPPAKDGDLQG